MPSKKENILFRKLNRLLEKKKRLERRISRLQAQLAKLKYAPDWKGPRCIFKKKYSD